MDDIMTALPIFLTPIIPVHLYQLSIRDKRLICLLLPMHRKCNVASAHVSYSIL